MEIHIAQNGKKVGIYTEIQIDRMLKEGQISLTDQYWQQDMSTWKQLSERKPTKQQQPSKQRHYKKNRLVRRTR